MLAWVLNTLSTTVYIAIELLDSFIQSFFFFKDMAPVNNTELDFSFILCNATYLLFVHSYVASKIENEGKNGRESNDEIKEEHFKLLMMVRWYLSLNNVRNYEERIAFEKESLFWRLNKGF